MKLFTVKQVADRLHVAPATVYGLCARKKLAHIRVGAGGRGTIRISAESLDAYMQGASVQMEEQPSPTQWATGLKHINSARRTDR